MDFEEYKKRAWETAIYPDKGNNFCYPALGLGGESGEVLEKIKKIIRDDKGKINEEKKEDLKKELGDVLWYVAALANEFKFNLDEIAEKNLIKLKSREKRNLLHGSGDNR